MFFRLLITLCFYVDSYVLAKTICSNQEDCVAPGADRCSVCVDDQVGGEGECVFLFPNIYQPTQQCHKLDCTKKCIYGDCLMDEPDGREFHMYCNCSELFHSPDCSVLGGTLTIIKYFRKEFKVLVNLGEAIILNFNLFTQKTVHELDEVEFYILYDNFLWHKQHKSISKDELGENYVSRTFSVKKIFPYRPPTNKNVYVYNTNSIGYKTQIDVLLNANNQNLFRESYEMFVSYENVDFNCFPIIELINCGEAMDNAVSFSRDSHVIIPFIVNYYNSNDGTRSRTFKNCNPSEKTSWKVWQLYENVVLYKPDHLNYSFSRSIHFPPFTIDMGNFYAEVEITLAGPVKLMSDNKYCFFNIICKPLVAVISGGSERMISSKVGLLLKPGKAYDPNKPPKDQAHVHLQWSCSNVSEAICKPRLFKVHQSYFIPHSMVKAGSTYHFTMRVWTDKYKDVTKCLSVNMDVSAEVVIQVARESETNHNTFSIECFLNCGPKVDPIEQLFLKAIPFFTDTSQESYYEWTYFEGSEGGESVDSIKVEGLPSYMLLLKEDSLKVGTKYLIVAALKNSTLFASYYFETEKIVFKLKCNILPASGIKGLTLFHIDCKVKYVKGETVSFEFYDKHEKEANSTVIFNGRMLGASKSGELKDVRLTRGNVVIYIFNRYGIFNKLLINVDLSNWEIDEPILLGLYQAVTEEPGYGSITSSLNSISFIPDIIPDSMDKKKKNIFNKLIGLITAFTVKGLYIGDLKYWASTLNIILITLNSPKQLELETDLLLATMEVIKHQAESFSNIVLSNEMKYMPPKQVQQVTARLLNSLRSALHSQSKKTINVDEDYIDVSILRQLKTISRDIERILELLTNTLSRKQAPGQPATRVSSDDDTFLVWVMEDDDDFGLPNVLSREKDMKVEISEEIQNYLDSNANKDDDLILQIVLIKQNIFWWSSSDVKTDLLSVSLKRHSGNKFHPITYIMKPVTFTFDLMEEAAIVKLNGSAVQLDPTNDVTSLDLGVTIHRLDLPPGSTVSIRFLFPDTNASLRVIDKVLRPDYEMMIKKATDITENSSPYSIVNGECDENVFIYMGIIPGRDVPVNQSVFYTFEISSTLCQRWDYLQWSSTGCRTTKLQIKTKVRCDCTHFSIFSAAFPVPPNEINPFNDAKLFLTVFDNPLVVIAILSILGIYLLLCAFIWRDDRSANRKINVIFLPDNFPLDKYPYLIAVYTSSRFNAGTTAHVGISVLGTDKSSRDHILSCEERKVLKTNSDDWFIILTPEPLGDITGVHVWHDNYGSSPNWYCNKIIVYDLLINTETIFIVNEWLSLQEFEYPEVYVFPAAEEDVTNVKSVFIDNIVLGIMENHVFLSCFGSHPRSQVTRIQRVSIFLCCTMVAMLCSIMFYLPKDERFNIDSYHFNVGLREIIVSIQSGIISIIVTTFVIFLFRRSYSYTCYREKSVQKFRKTNTSFAKDTKEIIEGARHGSAFHTLYVHYIKIMTKTFKLHPMKPINLLTADSVTEIRRFWLITAWFSCVSIIMICAYIVMLYGLKLGAVNSKEWLSSLAIAMGGEIIIFAPFRIILMSALLAMAIQKVYDVNTHRVTVSDLLQVKTSYDNKYIFQLIARRKHAMYRPLTREQREEILIKKRLRLKWWELVDFIISVILLIVGSYIAFSICSSRYYTNAHVAKLATANHNDLTLELFCSIRDISGMEQYLESTLVNVLYNKQWYQGSPLFPKQTNNKLKYWSSDYIHRILGAPQIRQLRVVYRPCGAMMYKIGKCIPPWTSSSEDTDLYSEHWGPGKWSDASKADFPWTYNDESHAFVFATGRLYGESGVHYKHGGYVVHLKPTRQQTELQLVELRHKHWQDVVTRVVFVEFTLYNVNNDLYVQVTIIVEFLASGAALPMVRATSVVTWVRFSLWSFTYIVTIIVCLFRSIYLINYYGLLKFLSHFSNVCRLIIIFFGILSTVIFIIHHVKSSQYLESFVTKGLDNYFDFDNFVIFFVILKIVMSLLICFVIIQTVLLLRAGKGFLIHILAIKNSLNWILWSVVTAIIILFILVHFSICFNVFMPYRIIAIIINKHSLNSLAIQAGAPLYVKMFIISKVVSIGALLWLFVVQFKFYVKHTKSDKSCKTDSFNFVSFLLMQLNVRIK